MDRLHREVILIRLIEVLRERGSWCGETHVQKANYLLQELVGVQTGFDFILYKHGPFSFDLRDELAAMRADGLLALQVQDPKYGPSLVPTSAADFLKQRFPKTLKKHEAFVEFVADKLGNKRVSVLERFATAFFVSRGMAPDTDPNTRAERVHKLKPHISIEEALEAVRTVDGWTGEAAALPTSSEPGSAATPVAF